MNRHTTEDDEGAPGAILHMGFINPAQVDDPAQEEHPYRGDVALHRPDSSLHHMLIMQPATYEVFAICMATSDHEPKLTVVSNDGVRIGVVKRSYGKHWLECSGCPVYPNEENRWRWLGDEVVERIHVDMTGWEVWCELKRRFG